VAERGRAEHEGMGKGMDLGDASLGRERNLSRWALSL